jgi:hypothetical protein
MKWLWSETEGHYKEVYLSNNLILHYRFQQNSYIYCHMIFRKIHPGTPVSSCGQIFQRILQTIGKCNTPTIYSKDSVLTFQIKVCCTSLIKHSPTNTTFDCVVVHVVGTAPCVIPGRQKEFCTCADEHIYRDTPKFFYTCRNDKITIRLTYSSCIQIPPFSCWPKHTLTVSKIYTNNANLRTCLEIIMKYEAMLSSRN